MNAKEQKKIKIYDVFGPSIRIRKNTFTEKNTILEEKFNTITFFTRKTNDKLFVKRAIEEYFQCKVKSIRSMITSNKPKRFKQHKFHTSELKKMYVTVDKIDNEKLYRIMCDKDNTVSEAVNEV